MNNRSFKIHKDYIFLWFRLRIHALLMGLSVTMSICIHGDRILIVRVTAEKTQLTSSYVIGCLRHSKCSSEGGPLQHDGSPRSHFHPDLDGCITKLLYPHYTRRSGIVVGLQRAEKDSRGFCQAEATRQLF